MNVEAAKPRAQPRPPAEPVPSDDGADIELSVVMPCLNEAATLETCLHKAFGCLRELDIKGEVIVADNGSTDGSREIAQRCGARVVPVPIRGYGAALQGGIKAARGTYVIMGDADDSYDFTALKPFVEKLREGYDLVMGNRFKGGIKAGAMPPLHRYLGNPALSFIGRLFFRSPMGDFHCGLRAFRRDAVMRMDLQTTGMEFASEMVVKAQLLKMKVAEVPTTLSPDGRSRLPHLRSWRDGWRHLRFLLMYSPRWLFLYPGVALMLIGAIVGALVLPGPLHLGNITLDLHTLVYAAAMIAVGFQAILFAVFTKAFAMNAGLLPWDQQLEKVFKVVTLEVGLLAGLFMLVLGLGGTLYALITWSGRSFGPLDLHNTMRVAVPSALLLSLGSEVVLSSFFLSILGLRRRETGAQ